MVVVVVVVLDWVVGDGDGTEVGASFGLVVVRLYAASRKAERRGRLDIVPSSSPITFIIGAEYLGAALLSREAHAQGYAVEVQQAPDRRRLPTQLGALSKVIALITHLERREATASIAAAGHHGRNEYERPLVGYDGLLASYPTCT